MFLGSKWENGERWHTMTRRKTWRAAARPLPVSSPVRGGEGGAAARFIHIISKCRGKITLTSSLWALDL